MTELTWEGSTPASTVMVVDTDVLVRMALASYLRECGYRVFEAESAAEAITVLGQPKLHVDVVLTYAEMPGSANGYALKEWIAKQRPEVRTLLAGTPKQAADKAGELCDEGPQLTKPFDPQLVERRIRMLIAQSKAKS